ncbi:MAG: PEGA domain-containing protein [Phycisphaerales bacterium]|nr:PEGA domain-containing protein [Phycisphaerales bacterium]
MRHLLPIVLMMLMMTLGGCVQRRMQITSQPAGALVYLNDQEVGRTPLTHDFLWYGDYDVQVRKDGYQTLVTHAKLVAPWWQWPPFDFVAELMPFRPTDERKLHFELQPITAQDTSADTLLERADEMRQQLQSPTTQP